MASEHTLERSTTMRRRAPLLGALLATALLGCEDPTRALAVTELGPEQVGVPLGPLHRPGQPCLTCHDGATARAFSVAGSVDHALDAATPSPGALVRLADNAGGRATAAANCAGNFFLLPEDFTPIYPLWVSLEVDEYEIAMDSPINTEGSCAGCHTATPSPRSPGRVYVFESASEAPAGECP
jgi:hypothetical protein